MADFDNEVNEGISNTEKIADGAKKAVNAGKKIAKSVANDGAKKTIINLLFGGLNPTTLAIVGGVLAAVILLSVIIGSTNSPKFYSDGPTQTEKIVSALSKGYKEKKTDELKYLLTYVNNKYGCTLTKTDAQFVGDNYRVANETCELNVTYTPELIDFARQVDAYANAVNSTIQFFEADEESTEITEEDTGKVPAESITSINEDGELETTDYGQDVVDSYDSEYVSNLSPKYFKTLARHAYSMFSMGKEESDWIESSYKTKKIVYDKKCYVNTAIYTYLTGLQLESKRYVSCNAAHDGEETIKREITVTHIALEVPMYCDPYTYKAKEVEAMKQGLVGNEIMLSTDDSKSNYELMTIADYAQANSLVMQVIRDYEVSYLGVDSYFAQIGLPGWDGDEPPSDFDYRFYLSAGRNEYVWQHVESVTGYKGSKVKGSYRQCTQFANAYLLDTYGFSISGDGHEFVGILVSEHGWKLLDTPAPGSIFSSNATAKFPYGHTGVVLSVHDGKMVVAEGNFDGKASIRIYETTVEQFINGRYAGRYVKFAAP